MTDKVQSLDDAANLVEPGMTVAIGGLSTNSSPMAFVREVARRGIGDLDVVAIVNGMAVEWLVAGGCVRRVTAGLVSLEGYGLAPAFRQAVQSGEIEVDEYSEHTLICRLQAQAYRLPFMPTLAGLGTDMLDVHPETTRVEVDDSRSYVACTPLKPDLAVVHAHEADARGYARVNPKLVWMDSELVKAAERTVVTSERIVPERTFAQRPERTTYPSFVVDAVAEVPFGCYPMSCFPDYAHHERFYREYAEAARDAEAFKRFYAERILGPESWADFLDANGGTKSVLEVLEAPEHVTGGTS